MVVTLAENSVRHIDTLKDMEAYKLNYQIRCSHHELEFSQIERRITCVICGKTWGYVQDRGFKDQKQVYAAEKE